MGTPANRRGPARRANGATGKRNEDGEIPVVLLLTGANRSKLCSKRALNAARINPEARIEAILRKEVIQPQVPLRLPCYDFTPVADPTVVACLLAVSAAPSGRTNSHGVTGGVYKARERIHRGMLIRDY
jgi:hypothetical protein